MTTPIETVESSAAVEAVRPVSAEPGRADGAHRGAAPRDLAFWPIFLGALLVDFTTKRLAEARLTLHTPYSVAGDSVRFTLTYNPDAAMSLSLGSWSRVVLTGVASLMLLVLLRMYRQTKRDDPWRASALGLIAAGALGNLLDRLRSSLGVVDFIDIGFGDARFWIFNVADISVTAGALLLFLLLWRQPAESE